MEDMKPKWSGREHKSKPWLVHDYQKALFPGLR
jgi:hypothetical protein